MLRRIFTIVSFALPIADAQQQQGVASDVRYIKCAACELAVSAAHSALASVRASAKQPTSEEQAQQVVERVCKPDADDSGAWLHSIDLVERTADDGKRLLDVVSVAEEGPCGVECATVALACEAAMDGIENELGEALYSGEADVVKLRTRACKTWSSACKKPPPKLDPARPDGPPFRPYTLEEAAMRAQSRAPSGADCAAVREAPSWAEQRPCPQLSVSGSCACSSALATAGPAPPGVLTADALRMRLGLAPATGAATLGDHLGHAEEAAGIGENAPSRLERATAFAEV